MILEDDVGGGGPVPRRGEGERDREEYEGDREYERPRLGERSRRLRIGERDGERLIERLLGVGERPRGLGERDGERERTLFSLVTAFKSGADIFNGFKEVFRRGVKIPCNVKLCKIVQSRILSSKCFFIFTVDRGI